MKVYVPLLPWRCIKCGKTGHVEAEATADSLTLERRLVDAHLVQSPECAQQWRNIGIVTSPVIPMSPAQKAPGRDELPHDAMGDYADPS